MLFEATERHLGSKCESVSWWRARKRISGKEGKGFRSIELEKLCCLIGIYFQIQFISARIIA